LLYDTSEKREKEREEGSYIGIMGAVGLALTYAREFYYVQSIPTAIQASDGRKEGRNAEGMGQTHTPPTKPPSLPNPRSLSFFSPRQAVHTKMDIALHNMIIQKPNSCKKKTKKTIPSP